MQLRRFPLFLHAVTGFLRVLTTSSQSFSENSTRHELDERSEAVTPQLQYISYAVEDCDGPLPDVYRRLVESRSILLASLVTTDTDLYRRYALANRCVRRLQYAAGGFIAYHALSNEDSSTSRCQLQIFSKTGCKGTPGPGGDGLEGHTEGTGPTMNECHTWNTDLFGVGNSLKFICE